MLFKTMSRKSNGGQLVAYVCRYILDPTKNKTLMPALHHSKEAMQVLIRHNLRARTSVKNFIKEFEENEKYRLVHRRDNTKLFHTVIAFGKGDKDKVTAAMLKDIGQRFIELRGLNNLYLGTAHYNTDSTHLHIVVSGTQLNGRSSRVSKQEHQRIKVTLEKYQREKYPQLVHSRVNHNEFIKQPTKEQIVALVQQSRQTTKARLYSCLQQALETSKTLDDFLSTIKTAGYEPYHRGEKLQGIVDDSGLKFRFSRLGVQEAIATLQERSMFEEQSLEDLNNLRKGKDKEKRLHRIATASVLQPQLQTREKEVLDEVSAVRNTAQSRQQINERVEQLPTLFDELNQEPATIQQNNEFHPLYED